MTNWSRLNAPWWESYARWLERGEIAPCYRVRVFIGDRQLGVVKNRKSVRVGVVDHDWAGAFAEARTELGL